MKDTNIIIIVAHNNLHLTKLAYKSAAAQDIPVQVLLIDNVSIDGTAQWAASKKMASIVYTCQKSLAHCWNDGLNCAWKADCKHALIINNDVELRPDTYRLLLAHGGPFVTCVSVNSPAQMVVRENGTVWGERPHPDFSCFLIRSWVTDKVGWFDESYEGAYAEDADYHIRMHRAGVRAVSIDLPFLHHGAMTVKNAHPGEQARIRRMADRNRAKFKRQYGAEIGSPEYYKLFETAL